ncbi:MAG: hypothetical protein FJX72_11335 [Armatimonadetes bacterium]|nr:hypothetical protein [Armatimonadota bacterium]
MERHKEWRRLALLILVLAACFYLPVEQLQSWHRLKNALWESLYLIRWYAQEHVLLCLVPAFFIAGAIAVFVSQAAVMKYLGANSPKTLAYGVASVSGTILAVCSCTVLPLFGGIYRMGAGLGPATAFLYAGPAINVLAIIMTARVLGVEIGVARAVGAVLFSVVIGLLMHLIFRKEEQEKAAAQALMPEVEVQRPLWQNAVFFGAMVAILVFANWGAPKGAIGFWHAVYSVKWIITSVAALVLAYILVRWMKLPAANVLGVAVVTAVVAVAFRSLPLAPFSVAIVGMSWLLGADQGEGGEWLHQSWGFAKQVMPLLLAGVFVAGLLLGRPGNEGLIPSEWVHQAVGGNSLSANFFASVAGAFMYFATLTEVPILQGLIGSGMGKGPALALLLAGPALSLPSMLVIGTMIGPRKTVVFVTLVVIMATASGMIYGSLFG